MTADDAQIREMVSVAAATCAPEAIVLFGSHAAGSAGDDPDVDL